MCSKYVKDKKWQKVYFYPRAITWWINFDIEKQEAVSQTIVTSIIVFHGYYPIVISNHLIVIRQLNKKADRKRKS